MFYSSQWSNGHHKLQRQQKRWVKYSSRYVKVKVMESSPLAFNSVSAEFTQLSNISFDPLEAACALQYPLSWQSNDWCKDSPWIQKQKYINNCQNIKMRHFSTSEKKKKRYGRTFVGRLIGFSFTNILRGQVRMPKSTEL